MNITDNYRNGNKGLSILFSLSFSVFSWAVFTASHLKGLELPCNVLSGPAKTLLSWLELCI